MANDKWIEDLAGKLKEHSSEVNPNMWQGISSQIGAGSAGVAGGLGFAKIASIVFLVAAGVTITYFALDSSKAESKDTKNQTIDTAVVDKEKLIESKSPDLIQNATENKKVQALTNNEKRITRTKENKEDEKTSQSNAEVAVFEELKTPQAPENILKSKEKINPEQPRTIEQPKTQTVEQGIEEGEKTVVEETKNAEIVKPKAEFINLPNTFTPNNDGVNDFFFVQSVGLMNYVLIVMDDRNNVLWKSSNPNDKWDGRNLGGEKVLNGSYFYFITAEDENGKKMNTHQRLEIQ